MKARLGCTEDVHVDMLLEVIEPEPDNVAVVSCNTSICNNLLKCMPQFCHLGIENEQQA